MFLEENFITSDDKFKKIIDFCLTEELITIDTEFVRNNTFYPKLCLLQLGTSRGCYAIDPFKIKNLLLLKKVLRKKTIIKIFHSPRQDLEIFFNLFDSLPLNIFDTQIAFSFISQEYQISYEKLVFKILRYKLDKTYQHFNWDIRPIKREQLNYALNDVYYLRKLYLKLEPILKSNKRYEWALEESKLYLNKKLYINKPENYWKNIYPSKFRNINLKKLKVICEWREQKCMTLNLSRKLIISDKDIIKIIKNPSSFKFLKIKKKLDKLDIDFLDNILVERNQDVIINQTNRNLNKDLQNFYSSKIILKLISKELNICENLIATTSDLEALNFKKCKKTKIFEGWRNQVFGMKIEQFFENKLKLVSKKNKIYLERN